MRQCALCLRELPLFRGLGGHLSADVCVRATKLRFPRGYCLFHQGEPATSVYLVKRGRLKLVQVTADGRAVILDIVGPGEVLGETALFQAQPQPYSAIVQEDAGLCEFGRPQFETMVRDNPEVAIQIIGYLSRRLNEQVQQTGETTGASVRERVLRILLRLGDKYGERGQQATIIDLDITQQELAGFVGASRVMVANVLKQLQEEGLVDHQSGRYQIRSRSCMVKHFSDEHFEALRTGTETARPGTPGSCPD
jgi:CRP/FNR family transcriptional regulator, cyclic AMP receptor protein